MGRLSEQDNLENLRERLEWSVALLGLIAAIVEDTNWACRCRSVSLLHLIECQGFFLLIPPHFVAVALF